MKVVFQFEKNEPVRFIGHLDIMRLFQRCMRRAGIPVAYSTGFHPHPVMSFAMPLALGYTSGAEFGEVVLSQTMDVLPFISRMNRALPPGIQVVAAKSVPDEAKALMPQVKASSYDVLFAPDCNTEEEAYALLAKDSIVKTKESKHKTRQLDIRPLILSLSAEGNLLRMTLKTSGEESLSPKLLLEEFTGQACCVRRTALLGESSGKLVSLIDLPNR